ncbi:MAG: hypothetical protein OEX22_03670 [Cyclobacteriaceae bacterium]|nr:hypothetical protein [Cyclobacteriaceae bacterium]
MKKKINIGDVKIHRKKVSHDDLASFNGEVVHAVCSTFALAREIEWTSRLFVLDIKEEDEEGVGTKLLINHQSPAFMGDLVEIEAVVDSFSNNELICDYTAKVGERVIATGSTGQKIIKNKKIEKLFSKLNNE